jgi:hypothetical protein
MTVWAEADPTTAMARRLAASVLNDFIFLVGFLMCLLLEFESGRQCSLQKHPNSRVRINP